VGKRRELVAVLGVSLVLMVCTLVPYLVAQRSAGEAGVFSGFLINPIDGFSYLSKMRQGAEGSWLFRLPYASEPGPGVFLFVYFLFLGHVADWTGTPLLTVYHAARLVGAAAMFGMGYLFFRRVMPGRGVRWAAFLLAFLGSGLGWLALLLGVLTPDLSVPEAIPFLSAYANAHFALACAVLLAGVLAVAGFEESTSGTGGHVAIALLCGAVLGIVQPFAILTLLAALGTWLVWDWWKEGRSWGGAAWNALRPRLLPLLGLATGAAPWLAYGLWVSRTDPALAGWMTQNLTPSPPLLVFAAGYGIVLVLAAVGTVAARPWSTSLGRLLLAWAVTNACLLYAPFGLQRRLALGLFFPLAALAAYGLQGLVRGRARLSVLVALAVTLSIPSNLVVVATGLWGVSRQEPTLVLSVAEVQAYEWVGRNLPAGALVLAAPETGNRLPAYADVRVLYGHPFETPNAEAQRALIVRLYAWQATPEEAFGLLDELGLDYVFLGAWERQIGEPGWLGGLETVYDSGGVCIYQVSDS
jgi:putative flippase GtrA